MRVERQITTEKKINRMERRDALKLEKENRLKKWHLKFVIYGCVEDWNFNIKTHVWFETIERKGVLVNSDYANTPSWAWRFRLPLNSKLLFLTRHESGLETWEEDGIVVMRCPECGTKNKRPFDNEGDIAVCHGGCGEKFLYAPLM